MSKKSNFRFSVIIPLEFHRGLVMDCLHRWVNEQDYPRDFYEIIAAGCKGTFDKETLELFESALGPTDRLMLYDQPHDIALMALAAKDAKEEILIFTESHCISEKNALSLTNEILHSHPEWAGFSGSTHRVTHNQLSVVEADMYESDIRFGMEIHPWLKLLDQYFVVSAEKYNDVQGFRMKLGHFAEWHLAARMHSKGYQIGYAPEVQVQHHYSGEIHELVEFTEDFTRGEMNLHADFMNDTSHVHFQAPEEWVKRYQWHPVILKKTFFIAKNAIYKPIWLNLNPFNLFSYLRWSFELNVRKYLGLNLIVNIAKFKYQIAQWFLSIALKLQIKIKLLKKTFIWFIKSVIQLERIRFVMQWLSETLTLPQNKSIEKITWSADAPCFFPSIGFHVSEEWLEQKFKWSEPIAMIVLPLQQGTYHLNIQWLNIKKIHNLIIYINEKPISIVRDDTTLNASFQVTSDLPTYFAITCEPWVVPNDRRILGLPVKSISITPK